MQFGGVQTFLETHFDRYKYRRNNDLMVIFYCEQLSAAIRKRCSRREKRNEHSVRRNGNFYVAHCSQPASVRVSV